MIVKVATRWLLWWCTWRPGDQDRPGLQGSFAIFAIFSFLFVIVNGFVVDRLPCCLICESDCLTDNLKRSLNGKDALGFQVGWEDAGLYECQAGRRREQVKRLLSRKLFYLSCCHWQKYIFVHSFAGLPVRSWNKGWALPERGNYFARGESVNLTHFHFHFPRGRLSLSLSLCQRESFTFTLPKGSR